MKICIIIPAYNEAGTIGVLAAKLREKNLDCVVINDGSTDETQRNAQENGAFVLSHKEKKGKGISLRDGFDYALKQGYKAVIAMDGDGQHDVGDIEKFMAKATEAPDSVITGSRMHNPSGMPLIRFLTNKAMSAIISFICKQEIPDTQCGFRYISATVLKGLSLSCSDFEIESEVLIESSRQGFRIHSVPIKTIYCNEKSKINPLKDTLRFLKYIIRVVWTKKS